VAAEVPLIEECSSSSARSSDGIKKRVDALKHRLPKPTNKREQT